MMTSYFNLLKYAATGIASPDMTYYDRMRASTLMGGGAVQTLTGIPPLTFKADGTPLISWSMKGNGSQQGTPTPDNPVMPEFVGVRTANLLFEKYENRSINGVGAFTIDNAYDLWLGEVNPGEKYSISNMDYVYGFFTAKPTTNTGATYNGSRGYEISGAAVVTVPECCTWIAVRVLHNADNAMLNLGTTALPYEPFGWAEKITCAGQTTPLYLGEVSTTRRIRKLVLTGDEWWGKEGGVLFYNDQIIQMPAVQYADAYCSHYRLGTSYTDVAVKEAAFGVSKRPAIFIHDTRFSTTADFKTWLADQYAAGTPVTVWYVLATEQTGIVNEPLMKIGDYSDTLTTTTPIPTAKGSNTLSVDTTVQPSEVSITGNIKPTT